MSLSLPCFKLECHNQVELRMYWNKFIFYPTKYCIIYCYILAIAGRSMYPNVLLPVAIPLLPKTPLQLVELSFIPQATWCCQYAASGCPTRVHYNLKNSLRVCRWSRKVGWTCATFIRLISSTFLVQFQFVSNDNQTSWTHTSDSTYWYDKWIIICLMYAITYLNVIAVPTESSPNFPLLPALFIDGEQILYPTENLTPWIIAGGKHIL